MVVERDGDKVQKTSKIQKKPPNLISNGMEKAGLGYGRQRGKRRRNQRSSEPEET